MKEDRTTNFSNMRAQVEGTVPKKKGGGGELSRGGTGEKRPKEKRGLLAVKKT